MIQNDKKMTLTELVLKELMHHQKESSSSICALIKKNANHKMTTQRVSAILSKVHKSPLGAFMVKEPNPANSRSYLYQLIPETAKLTFKEIYQLTYEGGGFNIDQALAKAPELKPFVKNASTHFAPWNEKESLSQQKALLEAHVRHELSLYKGNALKANIRKEIKALFEWLNLIALEDLITQEQVVAIIRRNVIDTPVPPEFTKFLMECAKRIHDFLKRNDTQVKTLLPKEQYDKALENVIGLKKLRKELTARSVSGSIYAELISDILYRTTKEFILTENIFVRNIPGASSLIKFGQETLSRTIPKFEKSIDNRLIDFIRSNIQNIMHQSEKLLNSKINEAFLKELGQKIWDSAASKRISYVTEFILAEQIESFAEIAEESWSHFRKSPLFDEIIQKLVQAFFEKYRHKNLSELSAGLGFTPEIVEKEALETFPRIVDKAIATGYLEKRLRERLATFYLPGDRHDQL